MRSAVSAGGLKRKPSESALRSCDAAAGAICERASVNVRAVGPIGPIRLVLEV
jgi:hypothetical protein